MTIMLVLFRMLIHVLICRLKTVMDDANLVQLCDVEMIQSNEKLVT